MELFRVSRNVWGQETLIGVSWDLLPWFFGAGVAFVVLHALWRLARPARSGEGAGTEPGA